MPRERATVVIRLALLAMVVGGAAAEVPDTTVQCWDWQEKGGAGYAVQALKGNVVFGSVPDSAANVVELKLHRTSDFSRLIDGSPRSELAFTSFPIKEGPLYTITWSLFLPLDYEFDSQQSEIIAQIHQSVNSGSPPISLLISGSDYVFDIRGDGGRGSAPKIVGSALSDRGRWRSWTLVYRADSSGRFAYVSVSRDGAELLSNSQKPNSYHDEHSAYFKLGIYKWNWIKEPSSVEFRRLLIGRVCLSEKIVLDMNAVEK